MNTHPTTDHDRNSRLAVHLIDLAHLWRYPYRQPSEEEARIAVAVGPHIVEMWTDATLASACRAKWGSDPVTPAWLARQCHVDGYRHMAAAATAIGTAAAAAAPDVVAAWLGAPTREDLPGTWQTLAEWAFRRGDLRQVGALVARAASCGADISRLARAAAISAGAGRRGWPDRGGAAVGERITRASWSAPRGVS